MEYKVSNIINLYLKEKLSLNEISKLTNISRYNLKKIFKNYNISLRTFNEQMSVCIGKKQADYTDYKNIKSVVEGGLLGDGGIYKVKFQSYYQHGCIKEDYIYYLKNIFENNNLKSRICRIKSKRNNSKDLFILTTRSNMFLDNLRNKWYENNIKIIPNDLIINKTSLKHWWIGDGYLNSKWGWGTISTQSFSKNEVYILKNMLNKITNGFINVRKDINSIGRFFIYLSRLAVNDIINYIGNCPVESFKYKWRVKC